MEKHIEQIRLRSRLNEFELHHLSHCPYCQRRLAEQVEASGLIKAPKNLKYSVLEYSRRPEVQLIAGTNRISRRLQLFYFTLKVSAAVLCVLVMLAAAPDLSNRIQVRAEQLPDTVEQHSDEQWSYYEKANLLTEKLNILSDLDREVVDYDKKER